MKRLWLGIFVITAISAGCNRGGGINSGTGGWPPSSASPDVQVSSSAEVVKITTLPVQIAQNGSADAIVTLSISPGFHVNANPATFPYLIATEVQRVPMIDGYCVSIEKPIYPPPINKAFNFADKPLAVYESEVAIRLPLQLTQPGDNGCRALAIKGTTFSIPISVRVQACDHEKCYPPANLPANIPVEVK